MRVARLQNPPPKSGLNDYVRRETDSDGRCMQLWPKATEGKTKEELAKPLKAGTLYKVFFKTKEYFESTGRKCFYPWVEVGIRGDEEQRSELTYKQITFEVEDPNQHYHIPLLISPYSYTTYRGS